MEVESTIDKTTENTLIRALIYGQAGTKKTTLMGTFPKPMWVANFDDKMERLYGVEGIDYTTYSPTDPSEAHTVFKQFLLDWKEVQEDDKYKTICIDGITALDILSIRHFVVLAGKKADAIATLPVYGEQASFYNYFFKFSINSIVDKNVIITAHEYYNVDKETGTHTICPLITGRKIQPKLPGMFKETWRMTKEGDHTGEVVLHYEKEGKAIASSLLLHGEGFIENPTYEKIMEEVNKS